MSAPIFPGPSLPEAPAPETLHPLLQEEITRLETRIKRIKSLGPLMEVALEIEKRFPDLYMHRGFSSIFAEVNVHLQLKSIKQVAEVLKFLAAEKGLRQTKRSIIAESGDTMWWYFPDLSLVGHFTSTEADACRPVQVGTKVVPVYELRCGDQSAPVVEEGAPS